jgi:hypothetical protein
MRAALNILALGGILAMTARGETLVDRLLARYDVVQSVQCEVRREVETQAGNSRRLSRVFYAKPDRLHVQAVSPLPRRIVADGTNLFSYIEGDRLGFSRPVERLDEAWLISLRQVPATPLEHLLRLRGVAEQDLPDAPGFPVRRGYLKDNVYAVVSLDASNLLRRIEFRQGGAEGAPVAQYDYENLVEPVPGAWFYTLQRATLWQGAATARETTRIGQLQVNQPIPENLFVPATFFPDVKFTDDLDEIYGR